MMAKYGSHRCGVCWAWFQKHTDWYAHITGAHGAELPQFADGKCDRLGLSCAGKDHAGRLSIEGTPPRRRTVDLGAPIKLRDGTVATPIPLPFGNPGA